MNLAGKDYFNMKEAAHYCCVSLSQFRRLAAESGIEAFRFMGRLLYRRADCQRAIEKAAINGHGLQKGRQLLSELERRRPAKAAQPRASL